MVHQKTRNLIVSAAAISILIIPVVSLSADIGSMSMLKVTDKVQVHETVTDGFVHPGVGLTKGILENARKQVLAKRDPWYSGFLKLAAHSQSSKMVSCRNQSKENPSQPAVDVFDNSSVEGRLKVDADTACRQALMYWFTGDKVYRANAMHIIRIWSQMDPGKYRSYREVYIHCSYPVKNLIMAAELLRGMDTSDPKLAWTEQDTADFANNFVVPAVNTFFNENGWFMNQNGYAMAAAMSGDIFTSDRQNYAKRVEWFTVNKDAPNKGWSFSIRDLARWVDTNALTGEKVDKPQVQLMEMGRDQAHAGDDMEIFNTIVRMMNTQGTKVNPVTGTISTSDDAVGPYEFLDDRILAAADYFSRFMFGYDTPWIPAAYDIAPNGKVRRIYPRIADNYRGRIREHDFWDLYYYYTCKKGIDLAKKTPYYYEAFTKRIVSSDFEWIYIPKEATGEAAKIPPSVQEPDEVEVEQRSSNLSKNSYVKTDGNITYVQVVPTQAGTRLPILSCGTDRKTVGLRIRTTGDVEVEMSGFARSWLLPNTQGQWRYTTYTMNQLEHFGDIVYFQVKGSPEITVDIDRFLRKPDAQLTPPAFVSGNAPLRCVAYVGAPVCIDFSATDPGKSEVVDYSSLDKPAGSVLDSRAGIFSWKPGKDGRYSFLVEASDGKTITPRKVTIEVAAERSKAIRITTAGYDPNTAYVKASLDRFKAAHEQAVHIAKTASDAEFYAVLVQLGQTIDALELVTPRLADGSMDFPQIVASSDIGESISLLVDGNDDTFPGFYLIQDRNYVFDFGPDFKFSATAFAMEGRLNFEDRMENTTFYGSNDKKNWVKLTPESTVLSTELTRIEVADKLKNSTFRFLRIQKNSGGLFEPSELRIYGQRHETGNKLESVTIGSEKSNGIRLALGNTVRVTIKAREPICDIRVSIQGINAVVRDAGDLTYLAEAVMKPGLAKPGPLEFTIDYNRKDGKAGDTTFLTTDGSQLILVDESDLIRNVQKIASIIDPDSGRVSADSQRLLNCLFDDNPGTFTEIHLNGQGAASYVLFDFKTENRVRLSAVELLARPRYNNRIAGAVVQGSENGKAWITLTEEASSSADWQSLNIKDSSKSYRYIRIFNRNNWYCNIAEVRFHGTLN
jgi:hypothetical protein